MLQPSTDRAQRAQADRGDREDTAGPAATTANSYAGRAGGPPSREAAEQPQLDAAGPRSRCAARRARGRTRAAGSSREQQRRGHGEHERLRVVGRAQVAVVARQHEDQQAQEQEPLEFTPTGIPETRKRGMDRAPPDIDPSSSG